MADKKYSNATVKEFADDDPFAELTRIIGDDSFFRSRLDNSTGNDLALDLEKELLGDFEASSNDSFNADAFSDLNATHGFSSHEEVSQERNLDGFLGHGHEQGTAEYYSESGIAEPTFEDQVFGAVNQALHNDEHETDFFNPEDLSDFERSLSEDFQFNDVDLPSQPSQNFSVDTDWDQQLSDHLSSQEEANRYAEVSAKDIKLYPDEASDIEQSFDAVFNRQQQHDDGFLNINLHDDGSVHDVVDNFSSAGEDFHASQSPNELFLSEQDLLFAEDKVSEPEFASDLDNEFAKNPANLTSHNALEGYVFSQTPSENYPDLKDDYQDEPLSSADDLFLTNELEKAFDIHHETQTYGEQENPNLAWNDHPSDPEWRDSYGSASEYHADEGQSFLSSEPVSYANTESSTMHSGQSFDGPPEIDTIEVSEHGIAVTDNLDLPHIPYRETPKTAPIDEFEELLAGAFGQTFEQQQAAANSAHNDIHSEHQQAQTAGAQGEFDDLFSLPSFQEYPSAHSAGQNDGWDTANDFAQASAPLPGTPPPVSQGIRLPKNTIGIAAAVAGLIVVGGIGVYALSNIGGGDTEVAIISADNSPTKMRPENPGGTTIPNQESQTYRRVAGETSSETSQPGQLVSATEEPVNLPLQAEPEENIEDLNDLSFEEPTDIDAVLKNEERLQASENLDTQTDTIATLTPRRVRSFVVRPDGTMVPREIPQEVASVDTGVPTQTGSTVPPAATLDQQSVGEESATVSIPDTAPIPTPRPANVAQNTQALNTQPVQAQTPVNAQPPAQVAAVEAPPVTQGAASGWSVQIASQPSLEGAQQTYQQMAQRHAALLQGKGVNIVKAEVEGRGTYFRVRIPSASKNDAINLCERLKSAGASCFVSQ